MTINKTLFFVISLLAVLVMTVPSVQAQDNWNVTLTSRQAEGLNTASRGRKNFAMAISPDGPWGWSEGMRSAKAAEIRALQFCRGFMRKGQRDCLVYMVNGKRTLAQTVKTRRVAAVYKPLNAKLATSVIGLSDLRFAGQLDAARALLDQGVNTPESLKQDRKLRAALLGRSIMLTTRYNPTFFFDETGASRSMKSNNGILKINYSSWIVTSEGLICMMNGRWSTTGKPVGTSCLVLGPATGGKTEIYEPRNPKSKRKAIVIAGDARYGAVR